MILAQSSAYIERPLTWEAQRESSLARRLPWLLFFRVVVATLLLLLALVADYLGWSLSGLTYILYLVILGSYGMVVLEGLLLRGKASPTVLSTIHLVSAVAIAFGVVHGTGGVTSTFSYLYLLAILDGAIIAGGGVALVMASVCSISYGTQLVLQLYRVFPKGIESLPEPQEFVSAVVVHLGAFYLIAVLAGHLAGLLEKARDLVASTEFDLHQILELHAAVLESLPLGVVTIDAKGIVNTANQAASWILNIPIGGLIGLPAPEFLKDFRTGDKDSLIYTLEQDNRRREISLNRSRVERMVPGQPSPAQMELTLVVIEDRTHWYAMERDLRAKERLAGIGELAAAIAHEIRNPLASMSGSLELLEHSASLSSAQRDKLRHIVSREVSQLNRLLENFLIYARPAPPKRIRMDLAIVVREVAEAVNQAAQYKEHPLVLHADGGLFTQIDPEQIRQLLWNLLKNAFEASEPHEPVELRVALHSSNSDWIVLDVSDRGVGVSPEIQNTMFDPFQTTKPAGTGLGLSIVHRIVENHGGKIDVKVSKYGGALFRVLLPVATKEFS